MIIITMIIQILLASILMPLNFCHGVTVLPPAEYSHTEPSNIETTRTSYDYSPGDKIVNDPLPNAQHNANTRRQSEASDNSWAYQPFIEYTNVSPHSKSITQIAFGKNAVEALQKSKEAQGQTNQNILYVQSEVAKPIDNQLPAQPVANNNYYYVPSVIGNSQDSYGPPPSAPSPVFYYTQVPLQQLHPVPHNENVVYITPQPQDNYRPQQNYYLVTHIQPSGPQTANQPELLEYQPLKEQTQSDQNKKPKNTAVDDMKQDKKDVDKTKVNEKNEDDRKKDDKDDKVLVESNTAKAIIEEYERHYIKRRKNVDVKVDGETGTNDFTSTTPRPYLSATTPLTITKPAPLSRQPIVVADLDENHLEFDDKVYSTTQSTLKTVKTSASLYHATQPLIVTPRPLGATFLAPITAGVQLQSVESLKTKEKDSVVVEIQKSVPYYLGKFEFVQNDNNPSKNEEIKQNVDLGANLLKYSIERLPNPQTLISEYKNTGVGPVFNQLSYTTIVDHGQDQEQEPGQFDYKIENAPYQQILVPSQVEVTKLEKIPVEPELPQPVDLPQYPLQQAAENHQPPQNPVRQVFVPKPHIVSVPIKTVADYVQKSLPVQHQHHQHIPPLVQQQPHYNQQPILLEPFPHVTKLMPQFVPLKHHQEVQKVPMKSYSYAPSYQPMHYNHHHHHHNPHNYQISHSGFKKQKSAANYPHLHLGNNYQTVKFNDYIGMKPPKIQAQHQLPTQQVTVVASASNQQATSSPPLSGPPFKASQHLQTVHEYLPATQLTDQQVRKYRNPRHSFGSSIRMEYGFMPPLIPSIEIDEFGKPIEKSES